MHICDECFQVASSVDVPSNDGEAFGESHEVAETLVCECIAGYSSNNLTYLRSGAMHGLRQSFGIHRSLLCENV